MTRRQHRIAAWLACLAMLMATLAPTLAHALTRATAVAPGDLDICSAGPVKLVHADDGQSSDPTPPAGDAGVHFEHCPFCLTHAADHALPPGASFALLPPALTDQPPLLFLSAPRPLFAWTAAQPRAPPVSS